VRRRSLPDDDPPGDGHEVFDERRHVLVTVVERPGRARGCASLGGREQRDFGVVDPGKTRSLSL
jgi:hypothetical protein